MHVGKDTMIHHAWQRIKPLFANTFSLGAQARRLPDIRVAAAPARTGRRLPAQGIRYITSRASMATRMSFGAGRPFDIQRRAEDMAFKVADRICTMNLYQPSARSMAGESATTFRNPPSPQAASPLHTRHARLQPTSCRTKDPQAHRAHAGRTPRRILPPA